MESTSILTVMPLSWDQLHEVPVEQKALYVSLCFLVSELNALQRLALITYHAEFDEREFDALAMIQANTINRIVSSKCVEIARFVNDGKARAKDSIVRAIFYEYDKKFADLEEDKGKNVAQHVRRKMTFHLDFGQVLKSTSEVKGSVDCNLYIHSFDGNCYFPACEDVIFQSGLQNVTCDAKHSVKTESDHEDWIKWVMAVVSLAKDMHGDVFERFLHPVLEGQMKPTKVVVIPEKLIFVQNVNSPPLFYGVTP